MRATHAPTKRPAATTWRGCVASIAADIPQARTLEIKFDLVEREAHYRIVVADDHSIRVAAMSGQAQPDRDAIDKLIGFALRRMLCRGLDKSEVSEARVDGKTSINVNLGKFR